ncbi:hypothetical protein THRCLA_01476 [Thraustotheca clavata]|uniref:RNA helicase n=1 Tax=Thraustotheca clavata TaxID=74557 RepID=A0A1W0A8Y8_9STRA|nr:hypothetical protein THRCLA_01476 [Thraustotheca clavata]
MADESDDNGFEVALASPEAEDDGFEVVPAASMPDKDEIWRKNNNISIVGPTIDYIAPQAMLSLDSTPYSEKAVDHFNENGFGKPTLTQAQSWPIILARQDLISIAKTGSGKTLAYLLPSFYHLIQPKKQAQRTKKKYAFAVKPKDPRLVVIVPTRELAMQIQKEAKKLLRPFPLKIVCIFGGASTKEQAGALEATGVDCLVATPGRLKDFAGMGLFSLDKVEIVVLDEADKMLELGFEDQIKHIMKLLPSERQTLLFSATWPVHMHPLAANYMKNSVHVTIGSTSTAQLNRDVVQKFMVCTSEADKRTQLKEALDIDASAKAIIFCRTKVDCEALAKEYADSTVGCVHGDKAQIERTMTMNAFKNGTLKTLFATDVAARGLDVPDIGIVINYNVPDGIETFVHRVGRTGRAGAKGLAVTLVTSHDINFVRKVPAMLKAAQIEVPRELIQLMQANKSAPKEKKEVKPQSQQRKSNKRPQNNKNSANKKRRR